MTVTLVRPARGGLAGFGTLTPVRVRPAPAMVPPDDDLTGRGPGEPATARGGPASAHAGLGRAGWLPLPPCCGGRGTPASRPNFFLTRTVLASFQPIGP